MDGSVMQLTITLWKWRQPSIKLDYGRRRVVYSAEHVNKMVKMLQRHLTLPYRVICLTDNPEGLECETQPIPAPELLRYGGCWNRLWLFSQEATRLGEYVVSLDLDTVITDNINPLFQGLGDFKIWQGFYAKLRCCGAFWALKTGSHTGVWDQFNSEDLVKNIKSSYMHPDCMKAGYTIGSDQSWMATKIPDMPTWTAEDGVLSYRCEARGELPIGARLVNFHGFEDPSLPTCQKESPWILEHWR
jgi:hypothetical protein